MLRLCVTQMSTERKKREYHTIGEAASIVRTTSETLRHYDRIGLVKPSMRDEWTNYRYYTDEDIVRLNTVRALQLMDLPLREIRKVLEYDSLEEIISFLEQADRKAEEKIASLRYSRKKIKAAKADYERKLQYRESPSGIFIREFPERAILLSSSLEEPSLDNLWDYLRHFYEQVPPGLKDDFCFEDQAGIYSDGTDTRMFAVCTRFRETEGLKILPAGRYLCIDCSEAERERTIQKAEESAAEEYGAAPDFIIQMIVLSGILQWDYQIQVPIGQAE